MIDRRVPGRSKLPKPAKPTPRGGSAGWPCGFCPQVFPSHFQLRSHRSSCMRRAS